MQARADLIRKRTDAMAERAERAVAALVAETRAALARGANPAVLAPVRALHRRARLRLDFVRADGSHGFHAPQESLRLLAEAIDFARQGQLLAARQH
jgi:nitrite reductase (cytochrome c-552)